MSLMNSTGERLRRATQLWHAYLAVTGKRFELAQFLKDRGAREADARTAALASGDPKLITLAQDWLRDTRPAGARGGGRARAASDASRIAGEPGAGQAHRYLRGVR